MSMPGKYRRKRKTIRPPAVIYVVVHVDMPGFPVPSPGGVGELRIIDRDKGDLSELVCPWGGVKVEEGVGGEEGDSKEE